MDSGWDGCGIVLLLEFGSIVWTTENVHAPVVVEASLHELPGLTEGREDEQH